jgi:hypothetical protein
MRIERKKLDFIGKTCGGGGEEVSEWWHDME